MKRLFGSFTAGRVRRGYLILFDDSPMSVPSFSTTIGCGKSDRDDHQSLRTVARFLRELQQVRDALELNEVHIFGHSWGTMLAAEYMLTKPSGVKSLILASPALNIPRWLEDTTL